jgi:hypothetical protein
MACGMSSTTPSRRIAIRIVTHLPASPTVHTPRYIASAPAHAPSTHTGCVVQVRCPPGLRVVDVAVTPPGILSATLPAFNEAEDATAVETLTTVSAKGIARGRARLALRFSDGSEMAVHYHVLPPLPQQVAALGHHWAQVAWLPREFPDPFGRSASVMPWDREDGRHVLQDSRAYIVGLSDDAGAGNNLGFATKVNFAPVQVSTRRCSWALLRPLCLGPSCCHSRPHHASAYLHGGVSCLMSHRYCAARIDGHGGAALAIRARWHG